MCIAEKEFYRHKHLPALLIDLFRFVVVLIIRSYSFDSNKSKKRIIKLIEKYSWDAEGFLDFVHFPLGSEAISVAEKLFKASGGHPKPMRECRVLSEE